MMKKMMAARMATGLYVSKDWRIMASFSCKPLTRGVGPHGCRESISPILAVLSQTLCGLVPIENLPIKESSLQRAAPHPRFCNPVLHVCGRRLCGLQALHEAHVL